MQHNLNYNFSHLSSDFTSFLQGAGLLPQPDNPSSQVSLLELQLILWLLGFTLLSVIWIWKSAENLQILRVLVCLLILRSLSSMLRGLKIVSSRQGRGWKTGEEPRSSTRRKWKKCRAGTDSDNEEEDEEGECFSIDSLENGKGRGGNFDTRMIKISTVCNDK